MRSAKLLTWVIVTLTALAVAPRGFADNDDDLRAKQERQRQIQAETDHAVNRITTMLRVMKFYGVDSPEKKVMEEMSGTLSKLSKEQMADVVRQLEKAAVAKNEKDSDEAFEKAHASHLKVLEALHDMAARFDAIKSLEEAALRFEEYAKSQLEYHIRSGQAIRDLRDSDNPDLSPTAKL